VQQQATPYKSLPAKPHGSNTDDDDANEGRHSNDHHENYNCRSHTVIGILETVYTS